jgi:hypothetical protein
MRKCPTPECLIPCNLGHHKFGDCLDLPGFASDGIKLEEHVCIFFLNEAFNLQTPGPLVMRLDLSCLIIHGL